jgi:hypothetical protein
LLGFTAISTRSFTHSSKHGSWQLSKRFKILPKAKTYLAQRRGGAGKGKGKRTCLTQSQRTQRKTMISRRDAGTQSKTRTKEHLSRTQRRRIAWMPGRLSVKMSKLTFPERRHRKPNAVHWPPEGVQSILLTERKSPTARIALTFKFFSVVSEALVSPGTG